VTLSNVAPDAVMLISPGDDLEISVNEGNMSEEVAFIWTAANDADNDLVQYFMVAEGVIEGDTLWGGAPEFEQANSSFEDSLDGWLVWPTDLSNFYWSTNGDGVYGSTDTFEALDGEHGLKIWGQYSGSYPNETPIYQGFNVEDAGLVPGSEVIAEGHMMSHSDDWVGQGANSAYLFISFFDENWSMIQSTLGDLMNASMAADEWHRFEHSAVVPEGAVNMNVGVSYWQVSGDDHGSVYFDEVDWYSPLTTTGIFVANEDLAWEAIEAGVTNLTWTWDVWSHDGFEFVPSSSGPRDIHVDVSELLGIDGSSLPREFALHNNYPNPFNPVTNIVYDIPEVTDVTLEIYNVMGQRVRTLAQGSHEAGRYQIVWNATNDLGQALSSGMYIYRIQAGDFVSVKKLVLMK
ncbi:MAG: T9SS type A sorting domain-containing protein, partial [Candidatus Marinimicrobia bacterium]|nr:T9SS type A sorting domain-containing protein [Candidatus Neomarinimicrobiota bacterium]